MSYDPVRGERGQVTLKASTGALLWSYVTGSFVYFCSPAVANGVVYVGSYSSEVDALNASTGALLWSYAVQMESSPTVVNGVVYVGVGGHVSAFALKQGRKK